MIWAKIKLYAAAAGAALLVAMSVAIKYFAGKAKREEKRADKAEKSLDHAIDVAEKDNVIDLEFRSRRADAAQELKDGDTPSVFTDPNRMFKDD